MLTFNDHWHTGEVLSSRMNPGFQLYRADGRERVWRCVGEWFPDVNIVNRVPHGGGGVMVWTGISYRQQTQILTVFLPQQMHHVKSI
jgi:hypothetical protein